MVLCQKCGAEMQLVRFMLGPEQPERFIYECRGCGVLQNPKANVPNTRIPESEIIKTAVEMGLALEEGVLYELSKGKQDFFNIFNLCRMQRRKVVSMQDLKRVSNERT